jgi:hypothetical protein
VTEYAQQLISAAWEVSGRRVASSLDATTSALVLGEDPIAAASAALGIARVQAARRRVTIADLVGGSPPLEELVSDGDSHGISDSFQFGVSLNRVAHQVDEAGSLFIMPSGAEPTITDDVLRSERWRLLADSYDKSGGLLLIVAPAYAPGLSALARYVNGAILAGDVDVRTLGDLRVLSVVAAPPPSAAVAAPDDLLLATPLAGGGEERVVRPPKLAPVDAPRSRVPLLVGGALVAAAGAWYLTASGPGDGAASRPDSVAAAAPAAAPARPDDPRDTVTVAPTLAANAVSPDGTLLVINPRDSAAPARFTVLLSTFPSAERARVRLTRDAPDVPAATLTPAGTGQRHQYVGGAYLDRAQADSLLGRLRRRGAVGSRGGSVVDRPFAFLLREGVPRDSAADVARGFRERRVPAYALVQPNGTVRLYSGAFETAAQANAATGSLLAVGVQPTLAYRTGIPE